MASKTPKPKAAKPKAPTQTEPELFVLLYVEGAGAERRIFEKLGTGRMIDWLLDAWRAHYQNKSWGTTLHDYAFRTLEQAFEDLDEQDVSPETSDAADTLMERLECPSEHLVFGGGSDDECEWELVIFDEKYFTLDASDYIFPPSRGQTEKNRNDGYADLLERHGKLRRR